MARSVAKITVDILRDPDWTGLTAAAQRLYALVILPQPKLTLCGYLDTISPARWSNLAADTTADELQAALDELEHEQFVVIDHDTEELVVRTFVKNDLDVSRISANVSKGFWAAWKSISSPNLRRTVVDNCPEEHWGKLARHAPADALQMRRSTPFEREPQPPSERAETDPSERETPPPSPSTLTCHLSPVTGQQPPVDTPPPTPADNDTPPPTRPPPAAAADPDTVVDRALALLVERTIARKPAHSNPAGYRRSLEAGKRTDHLDDAHAWLDRDPQLTPEQLADLLEPPPATRPTSPQPAPADTAVQALIGEIERNAARARGDACPTCHGALWLDTDRGPDGYPLPPEPCPDCNPEARSA